MSAERIRVKPTIERMCRLSLAQERVAESLIERLARADLEGHHTITLSIDEALAIATDSYETVHLARWAHEQLQERA